MFKEIHELIYRRFTCMTIAQTARLLLDRNNYHDFTRRQLYEILTLAEAASTDIANTIDSKLTQTKMELQRSQEYWEKYKNSTVTTNPTDLSEVELSPIKLEDIKNDD